jgi:hypothetical protein
VLVAEKIEKQQHFTEPPARYTEASLIKFLEENGIGRPSTYAPIISIIVSRDYVKRDGKTLVATELGDYSISYAIMDGHGNSSRASYVVQVVDQINPILTISAKIKSEIKLGAKVTLPKATATDDMDGDCEVIILVRNLDTYGLKVAKDGVYTFDTLGKYEIIYQTHDLSYNYTQYIFTVTVKGE